MTFSKEDKKYMIEALSLAQKGRGFVSPNPMVGAVIVKDGKVVGRGYHEEYGKAHAEVNALSAAGSLAEGATMYVTLEPCAHYGKTPPCSDQIIKAGVSKLVYAMDDPNPIMAKRSGRKVLEAAGVLVETGLLEKEAMICNEKFIKYIQKKMPYITLKLASTANGKIADRNGDSRWITTEKSRKIVHILRLEHDAIMVGIGTVIKDNPSLTVRLEGESKPIVKIIIDKELDIPIDAQLFEGNNSVLLVTNERFEKSQKAKVLKKKGVGFIFLPLQASYFDFQSVFEEIGSRGISSVFVEGGSSLANSLFDSALIDKFYLFIAPKVINDNKAIPIFNSPDMQLISSARTLTLISVQNIDSDVLLEYTLN